MSLSSRFMSFGFLGALFALAAVKHVFLPFNQDNAVHLKAARVILEHGSLYQHFFETNPPLFPYLTVVPVFLARMTGGSEVFFYNLFVYGLVALVLALTGNELKKAGILKTPSDTILVLGSWTVIMVGFQGLDLGQRDHIVGVLVLPYLVNLGLRSRAPDKSAMRLHAAIMVAVAIAIKPQFLPIWILGEAWILFRARSIGMVANRGNALIVFSGLAYLTFVYWREPTFYTEILPLVRDTYGAYGKQVDTAALLFWVNLSFLLGLVYRLQARISDPEARALRRGLSAAFFLGAQGAFLGYLFQAHYSYHLWPFFMICCAALPLALSGHLAQSGHEEISRRRMGLAYIKSWLAPAALIVTLVATTPGWIWQSASSRLSGEEEPPTHLWSGTFQDLEKLVALIDQFAGDKTWTVFSGHVYITFPAEYYTSARWSTRYHTLWPLPGLAGKTEEKYIQLKDKIRSQVAEDLEEQRPALVLVDVSDKKRYFPQDADGRSSFDYLEFFNQSAAFRQAFSGYISCGTYTFQQHRLQAYIDAAGQTDESVACNETGISTLASTE